MVRIYESDWRLLANRQVERAVPGVRRPSFADLIHEALHPVDADEA